MNYDAACAICPANLSSVSSSLAYGIKLSTAALMSLVAWMKKSPISRVVT